ncbi:MAG TPA: DUF4058 family protein [Pirellulaceae bacterium]|nr:DUF4058 family protein [Pirellulaceae bacterium]
MPVHDWTRVDAGVFHDFHQRWIIAISNALNEGLLPNDFYALAEQVTEGPIPDVVTLEKLASAVYEEGSAHGYSSGLGVAVAEQPPKVQHTHGAEWDVYAARATRVAIFHVSGDRVVAYIEIVSPGNKHSEMAIRSFTAKLANALRRGCHALVIDVHPPTPRDPRGIHARFWQDSFGDENCPGVTAEQPLGLSAYRSDLAPTAYFEPFSVGGSLIEMPVFLTPYRYVNVPLAATYEEAWRTVPKRWKQVIEGDLA